MIATLWQSEQGVTQTNNQRLAFLKACTANKNIEFEGGLLADENHPNYATFKPFVFARPYSLKSYLKKTKSSAIVFNTPAVHDCLGWKLAEFLALGKPIISTPLTYPLPKILTHGEEYHLVEKIEDLDDAIKMLIDNPEYAKRLQKNAERYFTAYVAPERVIKRIFEKSNEY